MSLTGSFWDFFIVFGAGVLVSFTPCVYPVLPLTVSCISRANLGGTRTRGFFLSLVFVLGMALVYCAMGVAASLTGMAFGFIQNQPAVYAGAAAVFFLFGLVMLDVIALPAFGAGIQGRIQPRNFWTVFLFGAVSGLVVGPCTAPVLGTLLMYIASRQNMAHGIILMFIFAYGVGFSLILAGTFTGFLSALPRSGVWMRRIKQGCGAVILAVAGIFFLKAWGLW